MLGAMGQPGDGESCCGLSEDEWARLIVGIEERSVVPIAGEGVVTFGSGDVLLYPELVRTLAAKLRVDVTKLAPTPTLSDVACQYLLQDGPSNDIYSSLAVILKDPRLQPGETLQHLAEVGFQLYLCTTVDPLLSLAVQAARGACTTAGFSPTAADKDLPQALDALSAPTVYHLLGRCSGRPGTFVAWEKDLLDFLAELPRHIGSEGMRNLADSLRSVSVLAIGLQLSDWVLRLLLRIAGQDERAVLRNSAWLADAPRAQPASSTVLFFSSINRNIRFIVCEPKVFVAELHRRWRESHPQGAADVATSSAEPDAHKGLVFISYAREDEAAVQVLVKGLFSAGCDVYLDRQRLKTGQDFDQELARQVSRDSAVFISVISRFTESASGSHYFHRERAWAAERLPSFAEIDRPRFYLPFCIDETMPDALKREPQLTKTLQCTHCPGGVVPEEVARRVRSLQVEHRSSR